MKLRKKDIAFIIMKLFIITALSSQDAGETILIEGNVMNTDGGSVTGAVVELWQADANGNYNHPRDAGLEDLSASFQYFGTSRTDDAGGYSFRTVKPSPYSGRPSHLHVKVKVNGREELTTQFYFPDDRSVVESDGVYSGAGDSLFLKPEGDPGLGSGDPAVFRGDLVLDRNGPDPDRIPPTPSQTEGPYYPTVDFSGYDNDLTDVENPLNR